MLSLNLERRCGTGEFSRRGRAVSPGTTGLESSKCCARVAGGVRSSGSAGRRLSWGSARNKTDRLSWRHTSLVGLRGEVDLRDGEGSRAVRNCRAGC